MIFREFQRLDEGAKVARGLGLGLSIVERIARVLDHKVEPALGAAARLALLGGGAGVERWRRAQALREVAAVDRGQLAGIAVLCIDNEPKVLDGMETLLGGWGCQVLKAPDLATAPRRDRRREGRAAAGCWSTITSTSGNGLDAIAELRRRFGADLPAILITADRSPRGARRGARARRAGAEQAAQARGLARADGAMARAAGGRGGIETALRCRSAA